MGSSEAAGGRSPNLAAPSQSEQSTSMSPPDNSIPVTPLENSDSNNDNAACNKLDDWPALSKPTRPFPKSSVSVSQGPVISQPEEQVNTNPSPKFNRHHTQRQKSVNPGDGNGVRFAQSGFNEPLLQPVPRPRMLNFGPRPGRRNGLYNNGHFGWPNQWTGPRGSTVSDMRIHQIIAPPPPAGGFMRPTFRSSAPFITPQHMGPFGNPMGFDMVSPNLYGPPESSSFMGMPWPMGLLPAQDPLPSLIVKQIDYYFSEANLVKDLFLRSNMDDQGLVPINLIANFPRVKNLTENIPLILNSLSSSTVVEVQGDKVRRRNGWERWIVDLSSQTPTVSTNNMVASSV